MKKHLLLVAAMAIGMAAQAVLPFDHTVFFAATAVHQSGDTLERDAYATTTDAVKANQWNGSGKANYHDGPSSPLAASDLSYTDANGKQYVDNAAGKKVVAAKPDPAFDSNHGHDAIFSLTNSSSTYTGKPYYASFLLRVDECGSSAGNDFFGFDGNHTGNTQRGRIFIKKGTASNTYAVGMGFNAANGTTPSGDFAFGTTILVVAKFVPAASGNESIALYVNPLLDSEESSNTPVYTETATAALKGIKGLTLRQRNNIQYQLAGLRFSETWADAAKSAAGGTVTPDPEPVDTAVSAYHFQVGFDSEYAGGNGWTMSNCGSSTSQNHGEFGTTSRAMTFNKTADRDRCTGSYIETPAVKGAGVLRFWVLGSSAVTQATISVSKIAGTDTIEMAFFPGTFGKTWTEYQVVVNDTNSVKLRLTTDGCNIGTGTLYIDDLSLTGFVGGTKPSVTSTRADSASNTIYATIVAGGAEDHVQSVELQWGYEANNLYRTTAMNLQNGEYASTIRPLGNGRRVYYRVIAFNQDYLSDTSAVASYVTPVPVDNSPVVFSQRPYAYQLYPRSLTTNQAVVTLAGRMNRAGMTSVTLRAYRNQVLMEEQTCTDSVFLKTFTIQAELAEYTFKYQSNLDAEEVLIADHVVAGDVLVLAGQSNAAVTVTGDPKTLYTSDEKQITSPYWRNYGCVQKENEYNPADTTWGISNSAGWSYGKQYCNGYGAYVLHRTLEAEQHIPTAILNYAVGGSTIAQNMPNEQDHEDLDTYYGRGLYRARHAGVQNAVRAIIWVQGEADQNGVYAQYAEQFDRLYHSWIEDYPGLERVYVSQINVGCGTGVYASELREVQRAFAETYKNSQVPLTVITNVGIPVRYDSCHYEVEGYETLYGQYANILQQDLYQKSYSRVLTSPMIQRVERGVQKLTLVFDQPMVWPQREWNRDMKDFFFDENDQQIAVLSGYVDEANPARVILETTNAITASALTYGPDSRAYSATRGMDTIYVGPWLRNAEGFAALTFNRFPITEALVTDLQALSENTAVKVFNKGEMIIIRNRRQYTLLGIEK